MPLYMIAYGDLGTDPDVMEIRLKTAFGYAFI